MSIFSRRKSDPLEERAEQLFSISHMAAVTLLTPLPEKSDRLSSAIRERGTEPWDFFATAAIVYFGLSLLRERVSEGRFQWLASIPFDRSRWKRGAPPSSRAEARIQEVIDQFVEGWYRDGDRAVADC